MEEPKHGRGYSSTSAQPKNSSEVNNGDSGTTEVKETKSGHEGRVMRIRTNRNAVKNSVARSVYLTKRIKLLISEFKENISEYPASGPGLLTRWNQELLEYIHANNHKEVQFRDLERWVHTHSWISVPLELDPRTFNAKTRRINARKRKLSNAVLQRKYKISEARDTNETLKKIKPIATHASVPVSLASGSNKKRRNLNKSGPVVLSAQEQRLVVRIIEQIWKKKVLQPLQRKMESVILSIEEKIKKVTGGLDLEHVEQMYDAEIDNWKTLVKSGKHNMDTAQASEMNRAIAPAEDEPETQDTQDTEVPESETSGIMQQETIQSCEIVNSQLERMNFGKAPDASKSLDNVSVNDPKHKENNATSYSTVSPSYANQGTDESCQILARRTDAQPLSESEEIKLDEAGDTPNSTQGAGVNEPGSTDGNGASDSTGFQGLVNLDIEIPEPELMSEDCLMIDLTGDGDSSSELQDTGIFLSGNSKDNQDDKGSANLIGDSNDLSTESPVVSGNFKDFENNEVCNPEAQTAEPPRPETKAKVQMDYISDHTYQQLNKVNEASSQVQSAIGNDAAVDGPSQNHSNIVRRELYASGPSGRNNYSRLMTDAELGALNGEFEDLIRGAQLARRIHALVPGDSRSNLLCNITARLGIIVSNMLGIVMPMAYEDVGMAATNTEKPSEVPIIKIKSSDDELEPGNKK